VAEALLGNSWVADIKGALGWLGLVEYLGLWDMLAGVNLNNTDDIHRWKGNSLQDQHIKISLSEPSPLNLGRKYGSRGHPGNVKLLCGWPFGTVVGLRTV